MPTKAPAFIPTEDEEQQAFIQWCRLKGILFHHSPLEMSGSSRAVKIRAVKMKRMGASKGFPDLLVFIPIFGATGEPDAYQPLALEMKRKRNSTTSTEQKEWLKVLEMSGIPSRVCKGAEEAIKFVEENIAEIKGDSNIF